MYGINNLSIVPVRAEASDRSELVTQLIFGDGYTVLEESENGKWIKIKNLFDEYEGWIDKLQHNEISDEHMQAFLMTSHGTCFDDVALVDTSQHTCLITLGSTLPFLKGRNFVIGHQKYSFEGELYQSTPISEELIKFYALRFLNVPYLWGGKTLFGIDCSGFTQTVFKLLGYTIKRDAYQQVIHGEDVSEVAKIKTGDLAFFENDKNRITHVGIILDNNKIIHAHGKVRIDEIDEKGILNLATKKYSHKLSKIKRIITV